MLSATLLPALEIQITAALNGDNAVVSGYFTGLSRNELQNLLDSGNTLRLTWSFRKAGQVESVVRFAHRDPLSSGYLIYNSFSDQNPSVVGRDGLLDNLTTLSHVDLSSLGPWYRDEIIEGRLYLDRDLVIPPISIRSLFGRKRDISPWQPALYPGAESE